MINNNDLELDNEHGGALIIILIVIALFVALSIVYTRMGSGDNKLMSAGQAKLAASEILKFSQDLERGWAKLLQNGCGESEISSVGDWAKGGYTNPLSPVDNSCHLFHENGGNVKIMDVPDGVHTTTGWFTSWWFTKINTASLGDNTCTDQFLTLRYVDDTVCDEINKVLGHDFATMPFDNHLGGGDWALRTAFQCPGVGSGLDTAELLNKRSFCYNSNGGYNIFVYALHER